MKKKREKECLQANYLLSGGLRYISCCGVVVGTALSIWAGLWLRYNQPPLTLAWNGVVLVVRVLRIRSSSNLFVSFPRGFLFIRSRLGRRLAACPTQGDRARDLGIYGAAVGCVPFEPQLGAEKLDNDPIGR